MKLLDIVGAIDFAHCLCSILVNVSGLRWIRPTCATVSEFKIPEAAILEMSSPLVLPEQRQAMVDDLQERFDDAHASFWEIVLTYSSLERVQCMDLPGTSWH